MKNKAVSGIMLTLLLTSMLTLTFNIQPVKASAMPVISVEPPISTAWVGETFTVDITVANISEEESLYLWDCWMSFDPSILNCTEVLEGPFLSDVDRTSWSTMPPKIDNYEGTVQAADLLKRYPPQGAVGSGVLCSITFRVKAAGATKLHFYYHFLWTYDGIDLVMIEHAVADGYFYNIEVPPPRTWTVDDDGPADFSSIQNAIDAALDGDTIQVAPGTYNENVDVRKSVSIIGAGASVTIVNASNENDYVFYVFAADNVSISDFTVTGTKKGIYHVGPAGISFCFSNYGSITSIIALNNSVGIYLDFSDYNTIIDNTITNNEYGIVLDVSYNNAIFHNNLVNNTNQVEAERTNVWDDGYPSGGNYWSDYTIKYPDAQELDGSGIWDTPYFIDEDNQDNYPLMSPWTPQPLPTIYIDPATTVDSTLTPGNNFTISIRTNYAGDDIWAYQFNLTYNPVVLYGVEVVNGDLITREGTTFLEGEFDNTVGTLSLTGALALNMTPTPPVLLNSTGPGILANVTFTVVGFGESPITLGSITRLKRTDGTNIVDAKTMPDHIQHGYFDNGALTAAVVDVNPDALNLKSRGEWITCYIELPEGYNVSDIDIHSIRLNNTFPVSLLVVPPVEVPTEIGDHDDDTVLDLMVKFNRTTLTSHIYHTLEIKYGNVTLTITGELSDGTLFKGSDTIRVNFAGDICGVYDGVISPIPDGEVTGLDFAEVALPGHIFGRYPTWDPVWGPICDLNKDGKVTAYDLMIAGINYGATVPPQP